MLDIQHRTKKDYAVSLIRDLILHGELDAGAHLNQRELAARLQISLTPVREALRQLEAEGLVAATAHRGVRVRTTDHTTLLNVYIARRLLEPYLAAKGVSRLTPADCRRAAELLNKLERAHSRADARLVRRANYDFHFLLYDKVDVTSVLDIVRKLWAQYPWDVLTEVPDRMDSSKREHQEILAAMEARDPVRAVAACEKHLLESYLDIAKYLGGPGDDPFPVPGIRS
jgi:DNA-binding GntR family transcriptional regulator